MAEKACHGIRRVDKYVDPDGREVLAFVQVYGKDDGGEPLVKGAVTVMIGRVAPNGMQMPPQSVRLEWACPYGTSVKKAFEMFDESAKSEVERFKKDLDEKSKANRVVGARAMPPLPGLLGANGKPMQGGN